MKKNYIFIVLGIIILTSCQIFRHPDVVPHRKAISVEPISDSSIVFEGDNVIMYFSKYDVKTILEKSSNLDKCDKERLDLIKDKLNKNWDMKQIHLFNQLEVNNQQSKRKILDVDSLSDFLEKHQHIDKLLNFDINLIHNLLQSKRVIVFNKITHKNESKVYYVFEEGVYCCCSRLYKLKNGNVFLCIFFVVM